MEGPLSGAPDAVVDGLRKLAPSWSGRARAAERARRLADDTVAELVALGAHRLLQPIGFGGPGGTIRDHVEAVAVAGEACPATAWCLAVWSVHNWMVAHFPVEAQADVWGPDPAVLVSASIVPRARFGASADGVVAAGRFPFASGCDHAGWFGVGGIVERDGRDDPVIALLPRVDVRIDHDTWHVSGLRATGSKDLVVDPPVEVPAHRVLSLAQAAAGTAPGQMADEGSRYRAPFRPTAALVLAPPALGAARAALTRFVERLGGHVSALTQLSQRDDPAARLRVADASAEIDAAELVLLHAADMLDDLGRREDRSPLAGARVLRDTAYGVRLCSRAVDRLFEASGGSALADEEPLQRLWRDVAAARSHAILTWDAAASAYAAARLG